VKANPVNKFNFWRNSRLFNIDFAAYTLTHHHFARHFHDHYVIELVTNGIDSFYCGGKNYTAENNQLVLINPGEVHTGNTVSDIPLQYYSLCPDKKALQQVAASLNITLPEDFNFQHSLLDQSSLTEKLKLLFGSFTSEEGLLKQEEIFFDCMHELLQPADSNKEIPVQTYQKDKRIQLLIEFIRSHYKEEISLQQLADLVCLNPFYLVRLFKKSTGISPYEYLLIVRTEHAKRLLCNGSKVQDAAIETGFYDTSHFNRMFYKITGTSPKSFRSSKSQYRTTFAV
jgi:AraC-like DNA-binding protein